MRNTPEAIEARLVVVEFILVEILAVQFARAEKKAEILEGLRKSIDVRLKNAPPELRHYALDCLARIFSSATETAKGLSSE